MQNKTKREIHPHPKGRGFLSQEDKGYVILADGKEYINCASMLSQNLHRIMPECSVTLLTTAKNNVGNDIKKMFDNTIIMPITMVSSVNDPYKIINDRRIYEYTPYEYTIKLEADMYVPRSIDHWWNILAQRDLVISTTIRNFKQEISNVRAYRNFIDQNSLPDCYNAITYFRKSELAEEFYKLVSNIFFGWNEYRAILKCQPNLIATTDWVYALAAHALGKENTTLPQFTDMSMVHMKQYINSLPTECWTDTLIHELSTTCFRINTIPQLYPVHYHEKDFLKC